MNWQEVRRGGHGLTNSKKKTLNAQFCFFFVFFVHKVVQIQSSPFFFYLEFATNSCKVNLTFLLEIGVIVRDVCHECMKVFYNIG